MERGKVIAALWLFFFQGILGAFDTLYYHELRARLPAWAPHSRPELLLHAARDFIYAALFSLLPWVAFQGWWALLLALLLVAEIVITLSDFVIEDKVRAPQGGVFPGERVTHAMMGLIYGAALGHLAPILWEWWRAPTALCAATSVPPSLGWGMGLMALGVFSSGVRDLLAALGVRGAAWPWPPAALPPARRTP